MKKLIIVAFILLVSTVTYAGPIITLSIEFGHGTDCSGRGICKITVGGTMKSFSANIDDNTGNLELVIVKGQNTISASEAQFVNGVFEVPAAYSLSAEVCSKLGINQFTIKSGKYKIVETRNQYKIVFQK
ncbi:MAG: hypothetical protein IPP64_02000 [Bacteroidetes bacterium]|nr:hypothetical protein [Bacteroidota bacterium]